ncbi:hypothetical protein ACIBHX_01925 [Nonomuraea sp. NPDC050536]|uniref:hypothetical protein n=1 Tax=Nonomuraea sp. NPDC050536 TaxID=3364366 RepID=UPI0037C9F9C5
MADWAKLIEAIAGLVGAVAWPVAVVLAVWLVMRRHRDAFGRLIDRVSSLQFPGGQIDLNAVVEERKAEVAELVNRVAGKGLDSEELRAAARDLAEAAEGLGRARTAAEAYPWQYLSADQGRILELLSEGTSDPVEIARRLGLAPAAVSYDLRRMYSALDLKALHEMSSAAKRDAESSEKDRTG